MMNHKIKELWEESQLWNGSDDGRGGLKIHESVEKFAELIVRECMEWCDAHGTIDGSAQQIRNSIKNHFGVEE